ncbi:MAG: NifU family protein [Candidatus Eisenbacteria bacterium]|nr:NifU family protein [Candidatus Eisenbacteria bacterium]
MLDRKQVEGVFDRRVRPALMMDGGNIELIDVKDNKVYVRLVGACGHCPSSAMTLQFGVEKALREELSEFEGLVTV